MPKRKTKSAALRAWKSMPTTTKKAIRSATSTKKLSKAQKKKVGSTVRKRRLASGRNPNTGGRVTSGQLGLKGSAKKAYRKSSTATKKAIVSGMGKSGLKSTGRKYNKMAGVKTKKASKK